MNFYLCILLITAVVVVCNASPIKDRTGDLPCSDCNNDEDGVLRIKRTPDYTFYEKRSESHSQSYERHIQVTGNDPQMTFVWVGNGESNANSIRL